MKAEQFYGRRIKSVVFESDELHLIFDDGTGLILTDRGQSCCESRYMTCDDDPQSLVGSTLIMILEKDVDTPDKSTDYTVHEETFVEIVASGGSIVIANHNEHNGYYGGFSMKIEEYKA